MKKVGRSTGSCSGTKSLVIPTGGLAAGEWADMAKGTNATKGEALLFTVPTEFGAPKWMVCPDGTIDAAAWGRLLVFHFI